MSRKQWGHGYISGYRDALNHARQKEIFETEKYAHWVPVAFYGSEGIEPISPMLCKFKGEHSCQSGGGGSMCMGLMSLHKSGRYALCGFESPFHQFDFMPTMRSKQAA